MYDNEIIDEFIKNENDTIKQKPSRITEDVLKWFLDEYFNKKTFYGIGRDRIFSYIKKNKTKYDLSQRQINRILQRLEINQLFAPKKKTKDIQATITKKPMSRLEMDLLDLSVKESNGYKYIMTATDTFSKYGFGIPMKSKDEKASLNAFRLLIKDIKKKTNLQPSTILTDNGSEFIAEKMVNEYDKLDIKHLTTKAGQASHANQVERFNLYLRTAITKYDTQFDNREWDKYLPIILGIYNKTDSRITKKTPQEIVKGLDNEQVKDNIEKAVLPKNDKLSPYEVGDDVRLKLYTEGFTKPSDGTTYSRQIYEIVKVYKANKDSVLQPSYQIKNSNGIIIKERFYHNDLLVLKGKSLKDVEQPEKFIVQNIIDAKVEKNTVDRYERYVKIKWEGYKLSEATWEPYSVIKADVPKKLSKWEKESNVKWEKNNVSFEKSSNN